jgi:MscS family membrane protein
MDLSFLNEQFLSNTYWKWATCGLILLGTIVFNHLLARLVSKLTYRVFKNVSRAQYFDEFNRLFHQPFVQLINIIALYLAFSQLTFPMEWELVKVDEFGIRWIIHKFLVVVVIWTITNLFLKSTLFLEYVYHNLENSKISKDLATFLRELTRVLIYIISFFAILGKAFEIDITALIAGLGIGGLAIALAAQDTLANLIGSFIIYLDKPFQVGELIELGEVKGVVEKIGFRTTRIRTLDRSLLIVPNKKIIDSNLNNITQSSQRRVRFNLSLTYHSEAKNILGIIEDVKKAILEESPMTAEDMTVRFSDFDASSLSLIVIYYVNSNDYDTMIAIKEKINIKIMEIVKRHDCQFAFPSQTVYLSK